MMELPSAAPSLTVRDQGQVRELRLIGGAGLSVTKIRHIFLVCSLSLDSRSVSCISCREMVALMPAKS